MKWEVRYTVDDTITIGELRRMDQLARFEDKDLLALIRGS